MTKFDFQFQNKVLALLLQDSEFLSRFGDIVRPENFADPSHQKICEMLCNYWKAFGSRPTFEALIEEVGRSEHSYGQDFDTLIDQIEVILDTDISEDREYYARQTVKFCREKSVVQALVNIGAVIGLLPVIGVPLPLVSSGGSSLVTTMLVLGMLMSFARSEPGCAPALAARPSLLRRTVAVVPFRRSPSRGTR